MLGNVSDFHQTDLDVVFVVVDGVGVGVYLLITIELY